MSNSLENLIRQYIHISNRKNAQGWHATLCKVCNDHGKKGNRAAFRFDGDSVGYNCFNCGHTAIFDPATNSEIPEKMVTVLRAFGIPDREWQEINLELLKKTPNQAKKQAQALTIEPAEILLPPFFHPITKQGDEWNEIALEYLAERKVSIDEYPFFIGKKDDNPNSEKWHGRLIIPIFKDKKLVFYQGRDMSGTREEKYLSPGVPKGNVLYGYSNIMENTQAPLYITEGWFDAYHIKGVAVFGRKMSPIQLAWLRQTNRTKVVVPDRSGDGAELAHQAIELGWQVSMPDISPATDVNQAIQRFGLLYVLKSIRDNTVSGDEAYAVDLYCNA